MKVEKNTKTNELSLRYNNHGKQFFRELEVLFHANCLTDVNLIVLDGTVPAHKTVLAASSTFFREHLLANPHAKEIDLTRIKFNHMEAIVRFMYSGEINTSYDDVLDLFAAAFELQVEGLVIETESHLKSCYPNFFECPRKIKSDVTDDVDENDAKKFYKFHSRAKENGPDGSLMAQGMSEIERACGEIKHKNFDNNLNLFMYNVTDQLNPKEYSMPLKELIDNNIEAVPSTSSLQTGGLENNLELAHYLGLRLKNPKKQPTVEQQQSTENQKRATTEQTEQPLKVEQINEDHQKAHVEDCSNQGYVQSGRRRRKPSTKAPKSNKKTAVKGNKIISNLS